MQPQTRYELEFNHKSAFALGHFGMQEHRKLAARVNIIVGWIGIVCAALALAVVFIFFAATLSEGMKLKEAATGNMLGMLALLALVFAALQFLFSIAQLAGGKKLLAGEKGMTGLMIVSAISLLAFPIGTIIGAYTIWVVTTCKHLLVDPSTVKHPYTEQMAQEGVTYNGKYYAFGEMHFDKLDDAFEYARQLKHQPISV